MFGLFSKKSPIAVTDVPCMNCGYRGAVYTKEKTRADFDLKLVPPHVRVFFEEKRNGVCVSCGIYQAFNRPDSESIRQINAFGKDPSTSWEGIRHFPVDKKYIEQFERDHFEKRIQRWNEYFDQKKIGIKRALFIRCWFGRAAEFVQKKYGADVSGLDMSEACVRTAVERVAGFRRLEGTINHALEGPFLSSGPYDAVFVFHVLTHTCDLHAMLRQFRDLVTPGGFLLMTHETVKKPSNPFHMLHLGEWQLTSLLRQYFHRIDRIDDCASPGAAHITRYTAKGDEADFVAWRSN